MRSMTYQLCAMQQLKREKSTVWRNPVAWQGLHFGVFCPAHVWSVLFQLSTNSRHVWALAMDDQKRKRPSGFHCACFGRTTHCSSCIMYRTAELPDEQILRWNLAAEVSGLLRRIRAGTSVCTMSSLCWFVAFLSMTELRFCLYTCLCCEPRLQNWFLWKIHWRTCMVRWYRNRPNSRS